MDSWSGFRAFAGNLLRGEFDVDGSRRGFKDMCASLGVSADTGKSVVDASANVLLGERAATPVVSLTSTLAKTDALPRRHKSPSAAESASTG